MYDIDEVNIVLIVSPIVFINADSSFHVDILCTMHFSDIHSCRFFFIGMKTINNSLNLPESLIILRRS